LESIFEALTRKEYDAYSLICFKTGKAIVHSHRSLYVCAHFEAHLEDEMQSADATQRQKLATIKPLLELVLGSSLG
jgi:hypothetical protein